MAKKGVLVVDVGGNNVKMWCSTGEEKRKLPSGPDFTPDGLIEAVRQLSGGWAYDRLSIGVPAPVQDDVVAREPVNLGPGWEGFDFRDHFKGQVKLINDAAMQALGSYDGGIMLFLGLGTGLGSTLVVDGRVVPMELAHLPYKKKWTYEDCVGKRGLDRMGKKRWRKAVEDVAEKLRLAVCAHYVVLGGGNVKLLTSLPEHMRRGDNENALLGGLRVWEPAARNLAHSL